MHDIKDTLHFSYNTTQYFYIAYIAYIAFLDHFYTGLKLVKFCAKAKQEPGDEILLS